MGNREEQGKSGVSRNSSNQRNGGNPNSDNYYSPRPNQQGSGGYHYQSPRPFKQSRGGHNYYSPKVNQQETGGYNYQSPGPYSGNAPQHFIPPQEFQQWRQHPPPNYQPESGYGVPVYNRYSSLENEEYACEQPYNAPFLEQWGGVGEGWGHREGIPRLLTRKREGEMDPLIH